MSKEAIDRLRAKAQNEATSIALNKLLIAEQKALKDALEYIAKLEVALSYYKDAERKDETCGGGYYSLVDDGNKARKALAFKPASLKG